MILDNDRELDPFNTSSSYSPTCCPNAACGLSRSGTVQPTPVLRVGGAFRPAWNPDADGEAVVSLTATDGLTILAGDALPTTSPPRDTYADVVLFDNPRVLFTFDDIPVAGSAEVPNLGTHSGGGKMDDVDFPTLQDGLIVGEAGQSLRFVSGDLVRMDGGDNIGDGGLISVTRRSGLLKGYQSGCDRLQS